MHHLDWVQGCLEVQLCVCVCVRPIEYVVTASIPEHSHWLSTTDVQAAICLFVKVG